MDPFSKSCNLTGRLCEHDHLSFYHLMIRTDLELIETIQYHYKIIEDQLRLFNLFSSPNFIYFYIFPFAYLLAPGIGISILWATVFSDFLTVPLKQLFNAHRPYWYVFRAHLARNISLLQYDPTCEVNSGFPCTNIVVVTTAWITFITLMRRSFSTCEAKGYFLLLTLVLGLCGIARAFYAANFIHHVIFSYFIGVYFAKFLRRCPLYCRPPSFYMEVSFIIILFGQISVNILPNMGFSQEWTYCRAEEACIDADRIPKNKNLNFEPFIRQSSLLFATGFSFLLRSTIDSKRIFLKPDNVRKILTYLTTQFILAAFKCALYPNLKCSKCKYSTFSYYFSLGLFYFLLPFTTILLVPKMTSLYQEPKPKIQCC